MIKVFSGKDTKNLRDVCKEYYEENTEEFLFPENSTHPVSQAKKMEEIAKNYTDEKNVAILTVSPYVADAINRFSSKYGIIPEFYCVDGDIVHIVTDRIHVMMEILDEGYDYIDTNTLHREIFKND